VDTEKLTTGDVVVEEGNEAPEVVVEGGRLLDKVEVTSFPASVWLLTCVTKTPQIVTSNACSRIIFILTTLSRRQKR